MMKRTMIGLALLALAIVIGLSGPVSAQPSELLPLYMQNSMQNTYIAGSYLDVPSLSLVSDVSSLNFMNPVTSPVTFPTAPTLGYSISAIPLSGMPAFIGDISAYTSSNSMSPSGEFSYSESVSASGSISNFFFSTTYTG
jgi:hypothetical protein